ncbi:MAG: hypothetical protein LCH46_07005 [Proteobacteria bacterium]|nr:hypothetical protein [Pseudomonadota bacterium]
MQLALLHAPLGGEGSGRVRYAAAMYFRMAGEISDEALEVYRILSRLDAEDPAPLLRQLGPAGRVPARPSSSPRS